MTPPPGTVEPGVSPDGVRTVPGPFGLGRSRSLVLTPQTSDPRRPKTHGPEVVGVYGVSSSAASRETIDFNAAETPDQHSIPGRQPVWRASVPAVALSRRLRQSGQS